MFHNLQQEEDCHGKVKNTNCFGNLWMKRLLLQKLKGQSFFPHFHDKGFKAVVPHLFFLLQAE